MEQFEALLDRKTEEHRRNMMCAGVIAATVANSAPFGDPKRKALSPVDFVPDYKGNEQQPRGGQSIDQQVAILKGLAERAK
jgi:hypothetical protein